MNFSDFLYVLTADLIARFAYSCLYDAYNRRNRRIQRAEIRAERYEEMRQRQLRYGERHNGLQPGEFEIQPRNDHSG